MIIAQQDFETLNVVPAVKLPAFALVGKLKDPASSQRSLRIAFQTLVGFMNLTGAEQQRPPMELETNQDGEVMTLSATFAPENMDRANQAPAAGPRCLAPRPDLRAPNRT